LFQTIHFLTLSSQLKCVREHPGGFFPPNEKKLYSIEMAVEKVKRYFDDSDARSFPMEYLRLLLLSHNLLDAAVFAKRSDLDPKETSIFSTHLLLVFRLYNLMNPAEGDRALVIELRAFLFGALKNFPQLALYYLELWSFCRGVDQSLLQQLSVQLICLSDSSALDSLFRNRMFLVRVFGDLDAAFIAAQHCQKENPLLAFLLLFKYSREPSARQRCAVLLGSFIGNVITSLCLKVTGLQDVTVDLLEAAVSQYLQRFPQWVSHVRNFLGDRRNFEDSGRTSWSALITSYHILEFFQELSDRKYREALDVLDTAASLIPSSEHDVEDLRAIMEEPEWRFIKATLGKVYELCIQLIESIRRTARPDEERYLEQKRRAVRVMQTQLHLSRV
jgi:hypothetical protein